MIEIFSNYEAYLTARESGPEEDEKLSRQVADILRAVREQGDTAVLDFSSRFDAVALKALRVPAQAVAEAAAELSDGDRNMFAESIADVRAYHQKQKPESWLQAMPDGSAMGLHYDAVASVGCYVPGGKAGYPSSVIMTVVPAQIAGVQRIVLVSPPGQNAQINRLVLACAGLLGISEVYTIGGAQAIGALAYGTETIRPVDKIVGPGNAYVNEAKRQVYGTVGIDSLAGPSEVVILADEDANTEYVTRDLIAQAEHDCDARAILVTTSPILARAVQEKCEDILASAARKEIVAASLSHNGAIIITRDIDVAVDAVNHLATEHLQLLTRNADDLLARIRNAGAIFVGEFSPVAAGDYCGGPNHVLPTLRKARFS
jgi:histidinol dehydrogenase